MKRAYTVTLAVAALLTAVAIGELHTSYIQSRFFSQLADKLSYELQADESRAVIFPTDGPYNIRQGYTRLPAFSDRLRDRDYQISRQARFSPALMHYVQLGGHPPFEEKTGAGLTITDEAGRPIFSRSRPRNLYGTFEAIPPVLVDSLLFIENRELLLGDIPTRNPAVEWKRLADAIVLRAANTVLPERPAPGGSTLATQMEKYRYSPDGLTDSAAEKFRQMFSASVRAYMDGPDTRKRREHIVRDYLNSTPLSGRPGYGEVQGLGDGLEVWFGLDFERVNRLLAAPAGVGDHRERARVFKAALGLMLAQRRPSYYLISGREDLEQLTRDYLRLLAANGVIDAKTRDQALSLPLAFRDRAPAPPTPSYSEQKAVNHIRTELLAMLGVENLYTLDQLDLTVESTLAGDVQAEVTGSLQALVDHDKADKRGLVGHRLLGAQNLDNVRYSFLLYESTPRGNLLRVQADNLDKPFDINSGAKLDLGSTAKLRTLVSYLEIVEALYQRYRDREVESLPAPDDIENNAIPRWAIAYLRDNTDADLRAMLDAAMAREYSAHPGERFFTGGGRHRFSNFDPRDNHRNPSVTEAFSQSINLVFIRLLRDIVNFHIHESPGVRAMLENPDDPRRESYLRRFADFEGREYLRQFYPSYGELNRQQRLETLAARLPAVPYRLAAAFLAVRPQGTPAELALFLRIRLADEVPDASEVVRLHDYYQPDNFDLNKRAYLADLHPLELWLVGYLDQHPDATLADIQVAGTDARRDAYQWLFRTERLGAQNRRIRTVLEQDAFEALHRQWQRLGYPFDSLVPSYATALGASADRPSALAELTGIILNNGMRLTTRKIDRLHFAKDTPYETEFEHRPEAGERVLSPEVSQAARQALIEVVAAGTGRRAQGVFQTPGGEPLTLGGKTGTADHRSKIFAPGGRLVDSRAVNRNAIFTFFIGDRYFGNLMVHVGGAKAEDFAFTSALPVQLFVSLEPALQPLLAVGEHHLVSAR